MQKATLYLENNCYALLGLKQVVNAVEKVIKLLTKLRVVFIHFKNTNFHITFKIF